MKYCYIVSKEYL